MITNKYNLEIKAEDKNLDYVFHEAKECANGKSNAIDDALKKENINGLVETKIKEILKEEYDKSNLIDFEQAFERLKEEILSIPNKKELEEDEKEMQSSSDEENNENDDYKFEIVNIINEFYKEFTGKPLFQNRKIQGLADKTFHKKIINHNKNNVSELDYHTNENIINKSL